MNSLMFVLILSFGFPGSYGGQNSVRVGAYNSYAQCVQQGQIVTASSDESRFYCIPVNRP